MKNCTLTIKTNRNTTYSGEFANEAAALNALTNLIPKDLVSYCHKEFIKDSNIVITTSYYKEEEHRDMLGQISFKRVIGDKQEMIAWQAFESEAHREDLRKSMAKTLFPDQELVVSQYRFYYPNDTMAFIQEAKTFDYKVQQERRAGLDNVVLLPDGKYYYVTYTPVDENFLPTSTVITKPQEGDRGRNQH